MSPKNKGTFGKGKAPVEQPDEFVQTVNSLGDRLQPHLKKIAVLVALGLAALIAWEVMGWNHDKKAKKATASYVRAMEIIHAPVVKADDPPPPEDSVPPAVTFSSKEEQQEAALTALDALAEEHSDMKLAQLGYGRRAKILLEAGRYDEAIQAYTEASKRQALPKPLRLRALEGIGYALEAKAMNNEDPKARQSGLEEALAAFANLQTNQTEPMYDYALYHQGRLLVAMGRVDDGRSKYDELLETLPETPLRSLVEERLESLGADPSAKKDADSKQAPAAKEPVPTESADTPGAEGPSPEQNEDSKTNSPKP